MRKKNKILLISYILIFVFLFVYGHSFKQPNTSHVQKEIARRSIRWQYYKLYLLKQNEIQRISAFFTRYNSPLKPYSKDFIEASDKYNLDWRLLPSISFIESTAGQNGIGNSYNPFGYICGNYLCNFSSFAEAINQVAKTISTSGAYASYRQTNSLYEFARVYNGVQPEEYEYKLEAVMEND